MENACNDGVFVYCKLWNLQTVNFIHNLFQIDDKSLRLTPVGQTYWVQSGNVSQSTANLTETDSQDVSKIEITCIKILRIFEGGKRV